MAKYTGNLPAAVFRASRALSTRYPYTDQINVCFDTELTQHFKPFLKLYLDLSLSGDILVVSFTLTFGGTSLI
jgi:hypothetical protein